MKSAKKHIQLADTSRVKRQQDPQFSKKRMPKEKTGESSEKRRKKEDQRDR